MHPFFFLGQLRPFFLTEGKKMLKLLLTKRNAQKSDKNVSLQISGIWSYKPEPKITCNAT